MRSTGLNLVFAAVGPDRTCSATSGGPIDRCDDRLTATARQDRHAPETCLLGLDPRRMELDPRQDRRDHDLHLELGESRPGAAAHASAEGNPGVGLGCALEEPLWAKRTWVGRI